MLWKKESTLSDALYVDICASYSHDIEISVGFGTPGNSYNVDVVDRRNDFKSSTHNKNDSVALQMRMKGNEFFHQGKLADAMEMYSESLCFAEPKSPHISLAYANRSNAFLKMKKYNECLIDIELAIEAGYPENLMSKLEKRRADCLEHMDADDHERLGAYEPKLSFEPNETFPCLANVVNFEHDENGICSVIANKDIAVGQTIAIEEGFTTCPQMRYGSKCTVCLKPDTNLRACEKCTIAMFCSDECQSNPIHEYECGVIFKHKIGNMEIVRGVLKAINMFPNVDELIHFVEEIEKDDPTEVPANLSDPISKYRSFLKSPHIIDTNGSSELLLEVYPVYKVLLDIPKIRGMFNTERKRRFLMHLIGQHVVITDRNLEGTTITKIIGTRLEGESEPKTEFTTTGVIRKYFGHSCAPNCMVTIVNNKFVYYTLRPIKSGEPLRHSLLCQHLMDTKTERQKLLRKDYQVICKCDACDGPPAADWQRKLLTLDSDYCCIQGELAQNGDWAKIIEKCISFLTKYGRMTWCKEIGAVIVFYSGAQAAQWLGSTKSCPEAYYNY